MPPAGFELTLLASERMKTHALDVAATGIGAPVTQYHPVIRCYTIRYTGSR
jgi:hypothetical protein